MKTPINYFKVLVITILFSFLSIESFSQQRGWFWQNPKITGNILFDVEFVDTLSGWAAGSAGEIFKSTDGGLHWQSLVSPVDYALRSISFVSESKGWIAGDGGTILKTNNGGSNWDIQTSNTSANLRYIKFINANTGYAFGDGGTTLTTINGGLTWTQKTLNTTEAFYDGYVLSASTAIAIGGKGVIFKTADGGKSWMLKTSNTTNYLYAIDFTSPDTGWIADYAGQLHKTTNGGDEWTTMNNVTTGYFTPFDLKFVNDSTAYASGDGGLYKSIDTAKTWKKQSFAKNNSFWGACFLNPDFCVAVGLNGGVVRTVDGGNKWEDIYPEIIPDISGFTAVQFLDNKVGYASGWDGDIVKTTDGGESWMVLPKPNDADLYAMFFINKDTGWVCGNEEYLAKTTNGGASWVTILHKLGYPYASIQFANTKTGWMLYKSAYQGSILKSTDGGLSWLPQASADSIACWDLFVMNTDTVFAGGCGQLYKSTNGGKNWKTVFKGFNWCIRDIKFKDKVNGWAVGDGGHILYTNNTGATWSYQVSNTTEMLLGISIQNNSGWIAGDKGTILNTANGGVTWIKQKSNTTGRLFSVSFPSADTGWVAGVGGCILKTIDGGDAVFTGLDLPLENPISECLLSQNYPNPFSLRTKIEWKLQHNAHVVIKVYDFTGYQVKTLVDCMLEQGEHSVFFDASGLPSGVYFYQLQADGIIETRKMVHLK